MPKGASKIATCCYCGTRAALVLRGNTRHELTCSSCGAPLHDLKIMPAVQSERSVKSKTKSSAKRGARGHPAVPHPVRAEAPKRDKRSKKYKKKSKMRHFLGEAFDLIEDIFD